MRKTLLIHTTLAALVLGAGSPVGEAVASVRPSLASLPVACST
jgi:hypothetical protein